MPRYAFRILNAFAETPLGADGAIQVGGRVIEIGRAKITLP